MFILTHVTLSGIGVLGDVDIGIAPGLTAVVGPNGCGKTTFLRGLVYGLTGVIDGEYGKQTSLQSDGVLTPGKASVTISDGNVSIDVTRATTASAAIPDKLVVRNASDGAVVDTVTGRKNVDAYLERKLGLPMPLLFSLCWARQGRLDSILTSSSAVISDFLRSVFDLKYVERLRSIIQDEAASVPVPDQWSEERLKEVRAELVTLESEQDNPEEARLAQEERNLSMQYDEVAKLPAGMTEEQKAFKLSRIAREKETLQEGMDSLRAKATAGNPMPLSAGRLQELAFPGLSRVSAAAEASKFRDIAAACVRTFHALEARKTALSAEISSCELELGAIEARKLREKLLCDTGDGTCALCGGRVSDVDSYRKNKAALTSGGEEHGKLRSEQELVKRLEDARKDLSLVPIEQKGTEEARKAAEDKARDFDALASYLQTKGEIQDAKSQLSLLESQMKGLMEKEQEIKETPVVRADRDAVLNALGEDLQTVRSALAGLREEKASRAARLEMLRKDAKQLEERLAQETNQRQVRALLDEVRSVLSAQRAQARFMRDRINRINENLASWLSRAGLPFTVELDPDSRQFVQRVSGYVHPAAHLSGAQKSIASVALLLALADVVAPNIRLFLFDEPAEALDAGNKSVMADSLKAAASASADGTSIVVTRDQEIIEACSWCIELRK